MQEGVAERDHEIAEHLETNVPARVRRQMVEGVVGSELRLRFHLQVVIDEVGISSAGDFGAGSRVLNRIGTDTSVTVGDVYYLGASWAQADADAVSTASGLIGVAVASSTNDGVLVSGAVKVADNTGFSSSTEGTVLYLDTTAGHVTATAPSATGDVVRVVGYVLSGSSGIIYFDPSKDWIELS